MRTLTSRFWNTGIQTLLVGIALFLAPEARADGESCFEFFQNLAPGTTGSCADVVFFGFNGLVTDDFGCAVTGEGNAAVNLFDEIDVLPHFFDPMEPVFSSVDLDVELDPLEPDLATEFCVTHKGQIGMFPLSETPPVGAMDLSRFIATGSQSKVVFEAVKDGAAPGEEIELKIEMEHDFDLFDSPDNTAEGELGTFFLLGVVDVETEELISDLNGSSTFDSASDPEPNFEDEFAPGYDGFTTTAQNGDGSVSVEFDRTLEIDIELETELEFESLSSLSIIADGFDPGQAIPWRLDSGNSFTFRISSPDPAVRFLVKASTDPEPEIDLPKLEISNQPDDQVRLTWQADIAQNYTLLFSTDLELPYDQWQVVSTVTGLAGTVNRDFPIAVERGFYSLRVSQ